MNELKRTRKRIFAIVAVLAIFFMVAFVIYLIAKPEPNCYDGIQNQREKGVDCGGPCAPCPKVIETLPLEVTGVEMVQFEGNKYDALVKIKNPNDILGAKQAKINLTFFDESGQTLGDKVYEGAFILPKEEKYILVYGLESESIPVRAEAEITEVAWEKFSQYEEPRLVIINKNYEKAGGGAPWFSQARGTLINKSDIDFETINVNIVLRDSAGKLLAVNSQIMNTVRAGEQRDFITSFSRGFSGDVAVLEVQAETNVFNSENYIKIHGQPEEWTER